MTTRRFVTAIIVLVGLNGCAVPQAPLPKTIAAQQEGPSYGYRPLDPLAAYLDHEKVPVTNCRILELFPDETVRLAVGQIAANGNVSYGLAKVGYENNRYVVILDYMKSDTRSMSVTAGATEASTTAGVSNIWSGRQVPTYVGIGLRLTANLIVNSGSVDLGNLIAIGAAAQAKQVSGTLVIQTLGISGESVASALPIPSEISAASIQNALVAIGTIKSKIYDPNTSLSPRVIGIYKSSATTVKRSTIFLHLY